jgi:hypothetical protein
MVKMSSNVGFEGHHCKVSLAAPSATSSPPRFWTFSTKSMRGPQTYVHGCWHKPITRGQEPVHDDPGQADKWDAVCKGLAHVERRLSIMQAVC